MKVEVLCATMHQKDLAKYQAMNLQTDAVFANQADRHQWEEAVVDGNRVKMCTTPYRGVGNNRNLALLHATGDLLMFADDDMIYRNGYAQGVIQAFDEVPQADMIVFYCETDSQRKMKDIARIGKVGWWSFMRYGTVSFVIRRESLLQANLMFTQLFGGGCRYCAGEDNLFLREALKKGLKVYAHPFTIAHVNKEKSSWFRGYDERYFFDNGAWLQTAFPVAKHLLVWYFVAKFSKRSNLSRKQIVRLQYEGIRSFPKGLSYGEWKEKRS